MIINEIVNFKAVEATNKEGKTYFCISIKVGEVEKPVVFLTKEQYLLITSSLKK